MFQTKITDTFGIRYPLVVGTMMHLARAGVYPSFCLLNWLKCFSAVSALSAVNN